MAFKILVVTITVLGALIACLPFLHTLYSPPESSLLDFPRIATTTTKTTNLTDAAGAVFIQSQRQRPTLQRDNASKQATPKKPKRGFAQLTAAEKEEQAARNRMRKIEAYLEEKLGVSIHSQNENTTSSQVKLPNGQYVAFEKLKTIPEYALDEMFKPLIDTKTYLADRIQNLTQRTPPPPRLDFFPKSDSPETVIFYNVFLPPSKFQKVLDKVIVEQIDRLKASIYHSSPLYHNIIGYDLNTSLCENTTLQCRKLRYMEQGNEQDTLQDLYEYCQQRPADNVIYLHDKGSFNNHAGNSKSRRCATDAAISQECFNQSDLQCDVCTQNIESVPHMHASGNMWRATCSYIRTLIPPNDFERRKTEMQYSILKNQTLSDNFSCYKQTVLDTPTTETDYQQKLGIGRYAFETWVFSHPSVNACYVMVHELRDVPNFCKDSFEMKLNNKRRPVGRVSSNIKLDFYQARGKLFEYRYLYNGTEPPKDSQFWEAWKKHMNKVTLNEGCTDIVKK